MRASYKIDDKQIDNMTMTISIAMTVKEWRELMRTKTETTYEPINKVQTMVSAALGNLTKATAKNYSVNEWLKEDID